MAGQPTNGTVRWWTVAQHVPPSAIVGMITVVVTVLLSLIHI